MTQWRSLAERACAHKTWAFETVFRHQFALLPDRETPFEGWQALSIGGRTLHHCPDLPICRVYATNGDLIALVVGIAVDDQGALLQSAHHPAFSTAQDPDQHDVALTQWVNGLAGRYVVITHGANGTRFFLDPSSSLGAVYCEETGRVASSLALLLDRDTRPNPDTDAGDVITRKAHYILGSTADASIKRPYSNHYINLETMQEIRHWPPAEMDFTTPINRKENADRIVDRLSQNIGAMARNLKVSLPITAGRDSRILLAGAVDHLDQIENFFAYSVNWSTQVDAIAGGEIAKLFGLPFRTIGIHPRRLMTLPEIGDVAKIRAQKTLASGFSSNGISDNSIVGAYASPKTDVLLRGGVAEMARAHVWRRHDFGKIADIPRGLKALKVSPDLPKDLYRKYETRLAQWQQGLPSGTADARALDFVHLELWLPAVPHVNFYVFNKDFFVNPYNDRAIIRETIQALPKYRKNGRLVDNIIKSRTPALADFPYHSEFGKMLGDGRYAEQFLSKRSLDILG